MTTATKSRVNGRQNGHAVAADMFLPVHDPEAEAMAAACVLAAQDAMDDVLQIARPEDFHVWKFRRIVEAARDVRNRRGAHDVVEIARQIGDEDLAEIGGPLALRQMMLDLPSTAGAELYAKTVRSDADRRRTMAALEQGIRSTRHRATPVDEVLSGIRRDLDAIEDGAAVAEPAAIGAELLEWFSAADRPGESEPLSTDIPDLDHLMGGGLRPGQLAILAARPGVGKSALAGGIASSVSKGGDPVLFLTLEQTRAELTERLLAAASAVPHEKIRKRDLNEQDHFAVTEAANLMAQWPLSLDDRPRQTIADVATTARRHKRKRGLALLIVDYLQLLSPDDPKAIREQQVSAMSRGLKLLAKELAVPVLCLSQLNRSVEQRGDSKPKLSDLRESGAIEQDADAVWFLVRSDDSHPSEAVLSVAKNRSGKRGEVSLHWRDSLLSFVPSLHPGGGF